MRIGKLVTVLVLLEYKVVLGTVSWGSGASQAKKAKSQSCLSLLFTGNLECVL